MNQFLINVFVAVFVALGAFSLYQYIQLGYLQNKLEISEENEKTAKKNLLTEQDACEKKLSTQKVVIKWKTKKVYIEKLIKKDTDEEVKSNTKPSNRFYLD